MTGLRFRGDPAGRPERKYIREKSLEGQGVRPRPGAPRRTAQGLRRRHGPLRPHPAHQRRPSARDRSQALHAWACRSLQGHAQRHLLRRLCGPLERDFGFPRRYGAKSPHGPRRARVRGPASRTRTSSRTRPVSSATWTRPASGGRARPAPVGSAAVSSTYTIASLPSSPTARWLTFWRGMLRGAPLRSSLSACTPSSMPRSTAGAAGRTTWSTTSTGATLSVLCCGTSPQSRLCTP